jgi:ubiquitin-small subunit ribosomal protein S27Ae
MAEEKPKKEAAAKKKKIKAYKQASKFCTKCGSRMGDHKDRFACGKCGYTEWKEKKG